MGYISDSKSFKKYMKHIDRINIDGFKIKQSDDYYPIKDKITISVITDLVSRSKRGVEKYNTTLDENNHQNMLQHAYEEALDMAQYLKKEITELNTIQDLVKQYHNDMELGKAIRAKYGQK
jgi:DNA-binding transcriptional regulator GbsR (MarR family)